MFKKYFLIWTAMIGLMGSLVLGLEGCASPSVKGKVGAQLWGENCVRCHNAPAPNAFEDKEWNAIGLHMKIRANLTHDELVKILEFLKMAN